MSCVDVYSGAPLAIDLLPTLVLVALTCLGLAESGVLVDRALWGCKTSQRNL